MNIIVDLDGTLAFTDHREHTLQDASLPKNKRWELFYEACADDAPNLVLINLLRILHFANSKMGRIEIWTGRPETYRKITLDWLNRYQVFFDLLRMRDPKDFCNTNLVKADWLNEFEADGNVVHLAFDDRVDCVKWWRSQGITCFDVAGNTY